MRHPSLRAIVRPRSTRRAAPEPSALTARRWTAPRALALRFARLGTVLAVAAWLAALGAAASPATAPRSAPLPAEEPVEVVTTLGVLADLARTIGGEHVHVRALCDPRQDPHTVEPRPTLMQVARQADLFVEVGLQLELWAEKVVAGSGNPEIQSGQPGHVVASLGVRTLELPQVLSREWGDVHPFGNPHVWLDPVRVKQMAANIEKGLAAVDRAHADDYARNLAGFQDELDRRLFGAELVEELGASKLGRLAEQGRLDADLERRDLSGKLGGWLARARALRGRPIVTYHKTAIYLADRFGFEIPLEIEEKPGIPPSARHRDHVLEVMRERGVSTILQEPYYDRAAADWLSERTGAHVVVSPIDVGEEVGIPSYFALIDHLLDEPCASEGQG